MDDAMLVAGKHSSVDLAVKIDPPTTSKPSFFRRFRNIEDAETPAEAHEKITNVFGLVVIILIPVAVLLFFAQNIYYVMRFLRSYTLDLILAGISASASYYIIYRRATNCRVDKVGVTDILLFSLALTFVAIFAANGHRMTDNLLRAIVMDIVAFFFTYLARKLKSNLIYRPLAAYTIIGVVVGGGHALVTYGLGYLIPSPLYLENGIVPVVYMLAVYIYVDCALYVLSRNARDWESSEETRGLPTVAGLLHRTFLGILCFPHPILTRMGIKLFF